jgi:3-phosphoshikimate 1-carboxyvinyltransferase
MIAPCLPKGLSIHLTTEVYSRPYIEMTLRLMNHFGVSHEWTGNTISILSQTYQPSEYTIESDWSGASYWYSMAAINDHVDLHLSGLRENSLQGDQEISRIMEQFGVQTTYDSQGVHLTKTNRVAEKLTWDFRTCPDLAQTVMVTAAVKGIELEMTGLESLRIKETDRIEAMANELAKLNARLIEDLGVWRLLPGGFTNASGKINTYDDHRMAMAFAPICQINEVTIDDPGVVAKSYPAFWEDLRSLGIQIHEL